MEGTCITCICDYNVHGYLDLSCDVKCPECPAVSHRFVDQTLKHIDPVMILLYGNSTMITNSYYLFTFIKIRRCSTTTTMLLRKMSSTTRIT